MFFPDYPNVQTGLRVAAFAQLEIVGQKEGVFKLLHDSARERYGDVRTDFTAG